VPSSTWLPRSRGPAAACARRDDGIRRPPPSTPKPSIGRSQACRRVAPDSRTYAERQHDISRSRMRDQPPLRTAVPSVSRPRGLAVDVLQPDGTHAGDPAAASALSEVADQEVQPSEHGIS
jgi:hypothetical protein